MKVWVLSVYENDSYDAPEIRGVTSSALVVAAWKELSSKRRNGGHSYFADEFKLNDAVKSEPLD